MNEHSAVPSAESRSTAPPSPETPSTLAFIHRWKLSLWLGFVAFAVYAACLSSTITYGGDGGELMSASYRLGIAHPTGYVFYTLLGRTFASLLPIGEVAWRFNLLSALLGAICVGLVTQMSSEMLPCRKGPAAWARLWAAGGAGALLAWFYFFAGQAVLAEVYTLNAVVISSLLFCAWRWHRSIVETANGEAGPDWRWLYSLALLLGLGVNAHLSCVFAIPGLWSLCVARHRSLFGPPSQFFRRIAGFIAVGAVGFTLTLYLPLRSSLFPPPQNGWWWPLDWTHPSDFSAWYTHIRAKQYEFLFLQPTQTEILGRPMVIKWFAQPLSAVPGKAIELLRLLLLQWLWCLPLVPGGAVAAWRHDRGLGKALLWVFAVNLGIEITYDVGVGELANFLFPAYIVMALWMAFGLHALFTRLQSKGEAWDTAKNDTGGRWSWRLRTLAQCALVGTVAIQLLICVAMINQRGDTSARDAASERAAAVEQIRRQSGRRVTMWQASDDALWSFWYAQYVLGRATGVHTPWGLPLRRAIEHEGREKLASNWMRDGELAMSYYWPEVENRFPYIPISASKRGLIWQASRRKLPLPAQPLPGNSLDSKTAFRATFPGRDGKPTTRPRLKREDLTRLTLDFRAPFTTALQLPKAPTVEPADNPPSVQAGYIQILVGAHDFFKVPPPPTQQNMYRNLKERNPLANDFRTPSPQVSVQTLRLVVPQGTRPNTTVRVALPMQMNVDALGTYNVWVRIVRSTGDAFTPWQKVATVDVSPT